eukprot:14403605-Alexandrium_andersonii.AAC.1
MGCAEMALNQILARMKDLCGLSPNFKVHRASDNDQTCQQVLKEHDHHTFWGNSVCGNSTCPAHIFGDITQR